MNKQLFSVMQRRGELLAKIAVQREQIAEAGTHWQVPLSIADRGLTVLRFLRSKPMLVAGAVAVFVIRRRGMTGLISTGWRMWRLYKSATTISANLLKK